MGMKGYWLIPVIFGIFILGTLGLSQDAFAVTGIFLNIEDIEGESKDKEHVNEIDVSAWSWGMSSAQSTAVTVGADKFVGGAGGGGTPTVQDLSITKFVDSATPKLMESILTGELIANAKLTLRSAGGSPLEFLTIEMIDVTVTSLFVGGTDAGDKPTETITLNFKKVTVTYTPQLADGSAGTPIIIGFDIATGAPL